MRIYLSLIFTSLTFLSLTTHAQTLEAIVGSENNFNDRVYAIAVNEEEQCTYVAGSFQSTQGEAFNPANFFNVSNLSSFINQPAGDIAMTGQGNDDFFVAKIGFDGIIDWFITGGGPQDDAIMDLVIGSDGNIYMTGYISFPSVIFYESGVSVADFVSYGDKLNAVVISIDHDGGWRWDRRIGSDEDNAGLEITDNGQAIGVSGVFHNEHTPDDDDETTEDFKIFGLNGPCPDDFSGGYIAQLTYQGDCEWFRAYTSPGFSYDLDDPHLIGASIDSDTEGYHLATILSGDSYNSYTSQILCNVPSTTLSSGLNIAQFNVNFDGTLNWSRTELLPSGVNILSGPFVSASCGDVYLTATLSTALASPQTLSSNLNTLQPGSNPTILLHRRAVSSGLTGLISLFPSINDIDDTYVTSIESDIQFRVYLAGATGGQIIFDASNETANVNSTGSSKNAWVKVMTGNTEHIWNSTLDGNQSEEYTDLFVRFPDKLYFSGFSNSQSGIQLPPLSGSHLSSIFGKYSQSATTGLAEFDILCPPSVTLNSNSECGLVDYAIPEVQIINPCLVQFRENNAPLVFPFGTTDVMVQAMGFNGTSQQCSLQVIVQDVSLENSIQCLSEITVNTDENACSAVVSIPSPVITGSCTPPTITNNFNNSASITEGTFPVGTTTVRWMVMFEDGEVQMCNTKVNVHDITPPTMVCNNIPAPLTTEGTINISVAQIDGGSFDACNIVETTISKDEFDCSNIGANQVMLTAIDANGNSNTCLATITVVDQIMPTAQCNDIEIELTNDGTISISPDQINNGSFDNCSIASIELSQSVFNCSNLGENNITLTVTDASGLQSTCPSVVTIQDLGNPPSVNAGADINTCANVSDINLDPILGEGVISVEWSGGAGNFANGLNTANNTYTPTSSEIQSGSLTLTITAFGNSVCGSVSDEIIINFIQAPTVFAGADQQVCSEQVAVLNGATATNQTSIQWTGGSGTFSPSANILQPNYTPSIQEFEAGSITLTITVEGSVGCEPVSDQILLELSKKPEANAGLDNSFCGNIGNLNAATPAFGVGTWTSPSTVTFAPNSNAPDAQVTSSIFGSLTFVWTVVNNFCTDADAVIITFFEAPVLAEAGADQTISYLGETTISATIPEVGTGSWSTNSPNVIFGDSNAATTSVSALQPGPNTFFWTITNGPCQAVQDTVVINVDGLIIPTGFSPNGDNINDTFEIRGIGFNEAISIKVLNRWGEEVFASDDYKNDWNGISKSGSELPNDTYYCVIESPLLEKTHTGYIIINR
ncbi:MAG: gliding motility-associated C-terminal domain-containing protein [Flavobacteriales bacterium]